MRYTEHHAGVPVIKDKALQKEAMAKLTHLEDIEQTGCRGCRYEYSRKHVLKCAQCCRGKKDNYTKESGKRLNKDFRRYIENRFGKVE